MLSRIVLALVVLGALAFGVLWLAGNGYFGRSEVAGTPTPNSIPNALVAERGEQQKDDAVELGVSRPKQILFGDLHVHTTFSFDAFTMSLPLAGGDGPHPVADACDFARYCSALDFWSINDHALALTPQRWDQTVEAIRQCNEVSGNPSNPDTVAYLGWEWTQVGGTPETHYGHKNVIIRGLEDDEIPTRPIATVIPFVGSLSPGAALGLGAYGLSNASSGGLEFAVYNAELSSIKLCEEGVPVRDLPSDCREQAATPRDLFDKLDDWGFESMVIPHGTSWGFYTPPGSSWDKQLTTKMHDPQRQRLVEVFSGHGNSEEYRSFREVTFNADGTRSCPQPVKGYEPSCWRAGEIIRARCEAESESPDVCEKRAVDARQFFVDADRNGGAAVVGSSGVPEWLEAGQCTDCFQPAFNYRPKNSVQYMMALSREDEKGDPFRFNFGFMAASDNHSARPGTGYKEFSRGELTEARFGNFPETPLGLGRETEPFSEAVPFDGANYNFPFAYWQAERQASFFLNGGLVAVHSEGRDRNATFEAMKRKEVYGTSGPRILLWFDLLNAPNTRKTVPMGGSAEMAEAPIFEVRALGSFKQKPGCPAYSTQALEPDRLSRLCQDECYHPSDKRRLISRIEVVRITPQKDANESVDNLIQDPWKVIDCAPDAGGCRAVFSDPEFATTGRDAMYYVRAIEEKSMAVQAGPLRCERDSEGNCVNVKPCWDEEIGEDCLGETEERAWSSPIFVNYDAPQVAAR